MARAAKPNPDQLAGMLATISGEIRAHQDAAAARTGERDALVLQLRAAGWSLGKIAKVSGLTRGRVAQIITGSG